VEGVAVAFGVLVVLAVSVWVISGPLRASRRGDGRAAAERDTLEAAKEAKYREIHDAEMDFRTGKLSEADYKVLDRALRAEAVDILKRLDEAQ
jgi:hypothetical protein